MLFEDFLALGKPQRVDITLEEGVVVAERRRNDEVLQLFRLGSFYVELSFAADLSEVFSVYSSDKDAILEPYLERIDISELLR